MHSLPQYVLKHHLSFMLSYNREFRNDFVNLLLKFDENNDELLRSIVHQLNKHFGDNITPGVIFDEWEIERQLMQVLNEPKILSFVRAMRLTVKLEGDSKVDMNSWIQRFQNFKFTFRTGIDLSRVSAITLDMEQLKGFDNLNDEEKSIIERLTMKEIDLLSKFTPEGIDISAMMAHLPQTETSFLLSLETEELGLIKTFGFKNIHHLSKSQHPVRNLNEFEHRNLINLQERIALMSFITVKKELMGNFTNWEALNEVVEKIVHLDEERRDTFLLSMKQLDNLIADLNDSEWKILRGVDHRVFSVASNLNEIQLNRLLLLPKGTIGRIADDLRDKLGDLIDIVPRGRPLPLKFVCLKKEEEVAFEKLSRTQRIILTEILNLPPRAVKELLHLNLDRIHLLISALTRFNSTQSNLNRTERFILNRMKSLSPDTRHNIAYMTEDDWHSFHAIRNFDEKTLNTLINLSNPGIAVLKSMSILNEEKLNFVKKTSETGLSVLAQNTLLISQRINLIMRLVNEEERRYLLNLDLKTRFILRNQTNDGKAELMEQAITILHKLSLDGIKLLQEMKTINNDESNRMKLLNFDDNNNRMTNEVELYTYLNRETTRLFRDLFNLIESDKKLIINLWAMFDRHMDDDVQKQNLFVLVSKLIRANPLKGPKLLANMLIVSRVQSEEKLRFLQNLNQLGPVFYMEWLQLSIHEGFEHNYSSNIVKEIERRKFDARDLVKFYDYSNTQHVEVFKWMLSNISDQDSDILFNVTRIILFDCLSEDKTYVLYEIFHSDLEAVVRPLQKHLISDDFRLAKSLFFNLADEYSTATWLSRILHPSQCFDLLRSEIDSEDHGISYLRQKTLSNENLFSMLGVDRIKLLEFSTYFDRGDAVPLLNKLSDETIVTFLTTDSGPRYFWSCLRNGRANLLEFLMQRLGSQVLRDILREEDYHEFRNSLIDAKSLRHAEDMATIVHMLYEIDPRIPEDYYLNVSSKLILGAQRVASQETIIPIVRTLVTYSISQQDLLEPIMDKLNPSIRLVISLKPLYSCNVEEADTPCVDSRDPRKMIDETKHLFNQGLTTDIAFHQDLLAYAKLFSTQQPIDPKFERSFVKKLRQVRMDTLHSSIQGIVKSLRETLDDRMAWLELLTSAGVEDKIKESNIKASVEFVMSLTGQYETCRDFRSLEYEALNFHSIPKMSLMKQEVMSMGYYMRAHPTILAISKQHLRNTKWDFDKVEEYMNSIELANRQFLCSMRLCDKKIDQLPSRSENESVLTQYVSEVIGEFEGVYDKIGLSLPRWVLGKREYYMPRKRYQLKHTLLTNYQIEKLDCDLKTFESKVKLSFDRRAVMRDPFEETIDHTNSSLMPERLGDFQLICGPNTITLEMDVTVQSVSPYFDEDCTIHFGETHSRISTERYRLHGNNEDRCQNTVLYERGESSSNKKVMLYIAQDYFQWESSRNDSTDIIFFGNDISFVDSKTLSNTWKPTNHYVFKNDLSKCKIHKKGWNFFHTGSYEFICDLIGSVDEQINALVIQNDFVDSKNIHFVYGDGKRNKITISHARFVDGGSGNDTIIARSCATVRGYLGDLIIGGSTVILPRKVQFIQAITIEPYTLTFWYGNGGMMELGKNSKFMSDNGYFVIPVQINNSIDILYIYKSIQGNIELENELSKLKGITSGRFQFVKQVSSFNWDIILTDVNDNVFLMNKDSHNYHWTGPIDGKNLYVLNEAKGNVVISQMNGIVDFAPLNLTMHNISLTRNDQGEIKMSNEGIRVLLLKNYHNIRVTFDGKKYYGVKDNNFARDFCSHPLKVEGKIAIDSPELFRHYNCLDFYSDKVYFTRSNENLILVSGKSAVLLQDYYTPLYNSLDLSLKLNHLTVTPEEFRLRAENPTTIKYYQVDDEGLEIYHNQPINKHQIGLIDLRKWSLSQCYMELFSNTLQIFYRDSISLKINNWEIFQHARQILLLFEGGVFLNAMCVTSDCSPRYIFEEFQHTKSQASRAKRQVEFLTTDPNPLSSSVESVRYYVESCIANNFGFLFFIIQHFFANKYPLPAERSIAPEEILATACNIARTFEDAARRTAEEFRVTVEDVDFFNVYAKVVDLIKKEKYAHILKTFDSIIESFGNANETFVNALKYNIRERFRLKIE